MKYKKHLQENIAKEYGPTPYLDYGHLDDIIRQGRVWIMYIGFINTDCLDIFDEWIND